MEFWKKTRKKKTTSLGALEKTMKRKTITLRFWPRRRRSQPWSFQIKPRKRPRLWKLWKKTMKKKTKPVGVLEKNYDCKKKTKPMFFYNPHFLPQELYPESCKYEGGKLKICVDLHDTKGGRLKLFKSHKKPRKR